MSRARLLNVIGTALVEALSKSGVLRYHGQADEHPCDSPSEEGCPRRVVHGRNLAVCGASPRRCADVQLGPDDLVLWEIDQERTRALVKAALGLQGVTEVVHSPYLHFLGSTPLGRQDSFVALAPGQAGWHVLVDRVKVRAQGRPFVLLVPTDGGVPGSIVKELQRDGCAAVFLDEALSIDPQGSFKSKIDIASWTGTISAVGGAAVDREPFVDVFSGGKWINGVDQEGYEVWLKREAEFDIFINEVGLAHSKVVGEERTSGQNVPAAYFAVFRKALETRHALFDPATPQEKDTLSRARNLFDIRLGGRHDWALVPTTLADRGALYGFRHDGGRAPKHALIFRHKQKPRGRA